MGFWLPRAFAAALAMVLGGAMGALLADTRAAIFVGTLLGGCIGAGIVIARDAWRSHLLLRWLRNPSGSPAPRDEGFWGEIGYRMEKALRQREQAIAAEAGRLAEFLSAIEASPNGVVTLDAEDRITWCNSQASDHFGIDPVRDRLQRVTNLVRSPAFVEHLQGGRHEDAVQIGGAGPQRTLSVLVRPYGDGLKLLLSQDITERERTEAMRRDFVANVSHEIRTPLTVLAGFVETLATLKLSDAERSRVLVLMAQQADRMQALVADLLTLAQLEGSPRPSTDRWVAVDTLLSRARADGEALSAGRHRLSATGGDDAEIAGSEAELLSAVGNLVGNGVRYTPDGGHIDLGFRWRSDGGADLEVADTGVGIAREHLPRLTERFYRVDGSRSRETGGTGLGLAIVKHVVQRHGGEIEIASEPGQGSTFKLVLPPGRLRRRDPQGARR